ncbi:hypothetical protein DOY81_007710 [Sarcophaga bullata]|nr:hypothetical protein DOY81_007710 [Sarcophaga bullata]
MACLHSHSKLTKTTQLHWLSFSILVVLSTLGGCWGHLNLYLNPQEVMRLLGVSAEVYYVRDGHINNYALNFIVPVPANVRDISFTWQSLAGRPLPYSINVATSDQALLPRPTMNISQIGEIPIKVQTFTIALKCSGIRAAEVDVTISIEIILNRALNNVTHLVFRRKKICLLAEEDDADLDDPLLLETVVPPPTGLITLVVGCVLALALVLILLLTAYCVRGSAKRQNHVSLLWHIAGPYCQPNVQHFYSYMPAFQNFILKLHVMCSSIQTLTHKEKKPSQWINSGSPQKKVVPDSSSHFFAVILDDFNSSLYSSVHPCSLCM